MGQWFVDRGWVPALAELDVGHVKDGGDLPRWARDDDDYLRMLKTYHRVSDEKAQEMLEHAHDRSWIADVAGLVICSKSRLDTMKLGHLHQEAVYSWTWLCEVKVTRSDFLKDDKFGKPPQAHIQLLAVPKGLVALEEIPRGWGLLEVKGDRVYKNMDCLTLHEVPREVESSFIERMTWAMWWRHHNESTRNFQRKMGEQKSAYNDSRKVTHIVQATVEYITARNPRLGGDELVDYLRRHQIRRKPAEWVVKLAEKAREEFRSDA